MDLFNKWKRNYFLTAYDVIIPRIRKQDGVWVVVLSARINKIMDRNILCAEFMSNHVKAKAWCEVANGTYDLGPLDITSKVFND